MDFKETADSLVEKGKAVLDVNGDGNVEAQEVIDALTARVKETAEAAGAAAEEIKKGFDADADGKVPIDEVKAVADGVVNKAKEAFDGLMNKATEAVDAEAVETAEYEVVEDAPAAAPVEPEAEVVEAEPVAEEVPAEVENEVEQ